MAQTERRYTPRRSTQRRESGSGSNILRTAFAAVAVVGGVIAVDSVGGPSAGEVAGDLANKAGSVLDSAFPTEADYLGSGRMYNEPIDAGVEKQFMTEGFGIVEIPVREGPGPNKKQIGITLGGLLVNGEEYWGYVYSSNYTVGKTVGPDGYSYGLWFKAKEVPLFEKGEGGQYNQIGVAEDVYMAENFLTLPQEPASE